ncbi:DUF1194 domain-containing protein [Labrenzia suaedae]|uniref:DUF1194 domain-containing protein n=2 Tax=Roseibium litorale TaxID=2803841 RepID=A0ABR9CGJ6_9HYPH|nr:DUF1194 domain-containing protein [Roseibium litorale]MBD8890010.1 DUF1194 domain-containing protein [Roseibium litorale]
MWNTGCLQRVAGALAVTVAVTVALALTLGLLPAAPARAQQADGLRVDVALALAVDVSRSMSPEELEIQRQGYAAAIASPQVIQAIQYGAYGRIAITFFEWAGTAHIREIVGWTVIGSAADAEAVAAKLLENRGASASRTSISGAILHGTELLKSAPYAADRLVIDISGDGPNNEGIMVTLARDAAVESGVAINGLPLMTTGGFYSGFSIDDLDAYYRNCVIGGPASFVIPVNDWKQFPEAVRRKLVLEIGGLTPDQQPSAPLNAPLTAPVIKAQFSPRANSAAYDCLIGEKIWEQRRQRFYLDP